MNLDSMAVSLGRKPSLLTARIVSIYYRHGLSHAWNTEFSKWQFVLLMVFLFCSLFVQLKQNFTPLTRIIMINYVLLQYFCDRSLCVYSIHVACIHYITCIQYYTCINMMYGVYQPIYCTVWSIHLVHFWWFFNFPHVWIISIGLAVTLC